MSCDTDDIGYKKPPIHTRWKKGQCGNPRARRQKPKSNVVEMIDRLLARKVEEAGTLATPLTALQAIVLQLWSKALAGDRRASAILLQFRQTDPEIAKQAVTVTGGLPKADSEPATR